MKRKHLEKAVLLTVMLMSLHGVAGAAEPVTADGANKEVQVTGETVINADATTGLNAINGGSITVNGSGQLVINKNQEGNAIAIGDPQNVPEGETGSSGTLTINDGVKLVVDMDINNIQKENTSGIYLTGNDSKLDIGAGGLQVDVTVNNSDAQYIRGINQEGGILTANGVVDVTMSAQTNALYITGIDVRNYYDESKLYLNKGANVTVTGNGNDTASAVGLYSVSNGELLADGKVVLNISDAKMNNGIIVTGSDVTKENLHLKDLEATVSGGAENYGMQVRGGLAVLDNAVINVKDGTDKNAGIWAWSKADSDVSVVKLGNADIDVSGGDRTYALIAQGENNSIEADGVVGITAKDAASNYGIYAEASSVAMNGSTTIETLNGGYNYGVITSLDGTFTAENILQVTAANGTDGNYAVYANGGTITAGDAILKAEGKNAFGVVSKTVSGVASDVTFSGNAAIEAAIAARANGADSVVTFENGLTAGALSATQLQAMGGGLVTVNSSGNGIVNYNGVTHMEIGNGSAVDMNLNNKESYWNLTASSEMRNFNIANNALLDMTKDNGANSILYVTGDMNGNGGVIKMDVDAVEAANNDSLLVEGTHSGTHYINLNVINSKESNDAVVGKVLASVASETGNFIANDVEGALYWNSFELDSKQSTEAGYNTDWYISSVEQQADKGTTSVDTIVGANALNYHTWRAENDQLMRRMGELRANGADEQGAWFRVHGSKISHDDIAGFENQYTSYELGYDQVTKQTEDMTRYTGAALSYTDGSSSYDSGSGENHSKALSFYNTDIYKSGHYLDLVFKYANMDNDFSVYDTAGQNITGEYKNNGISVSAEYGRKNDLNSGWYIEPQAQVTLGYFGGDDYETSNGIKVEQSGITSVLGRVGFNIGKEIGDSGVIYAKANLLHEFGGGYDIDMTDSAGNRRTESDTFNDTWFEYGIGAALKTGKNNHLYFDFVKTAGGDFEKDWQWNAGMRWTF